MKQLMLRAVLVLGLLFGAAGTAWAQCAATVEGGGFSGELLMTFTQDRWATVLTSDLRLVTIYTEVTVGVYRLNDGSYIFLTCGASSPEYVTPE
jgi:hypothetical protein